MDKSVDKSELTPPVGRVIRDDTFPLRASFVLGFLTGLLAGLVLMMVRGCVS